MRTIVEFGSSEATSSAAEEERKARKKRPTIRFYEEDFEVPRKKGRSPSPSNASSHSVYQESSPVLPVPPCESSTPQRSISTSTPLANRQDGSLISQDIREIRSK